MEGGRLESQDLSGGGENWEFYATPGAKGWASFVVLEGKIKGDSAWPPNVLGDESLLIGTGGKGRDNYVSLIKDFKFLLSDVNTIMDIMFAAKLQSPDAEGVVAQAAAKIGYPIYRLIGKECQLIALSSAQAAGEKCISTMDEYNLEVISGMRPRYVWWDILAAAASRVEMELPEQIPYYYNKSRIGNYDYQAGGILSPFSALRPSVSRMFHDAQRTDLEAGELPPLVEAGEVGLPQRIRGGIAHVFDNIFTTGVKWGCMRRLTTAHQEEGLSCGGASAAQVLQDDLVEVPLADLDRLEVRGLAHRFAQFRTTIISGAKWGYNKFRCVLGVTPAAELLGLPLTTAHDEGLLSERTRRLIDIMGQVYAACLAGCFVSYSVLKEAPVHISSTIYGGLAIVTFVLYMAMLSRSVARARLAFRLVSVTAMSVLTVSFVSQLSGPTYVKVLSALAGAVMNFIMMLLPF